MSSVGEDFPKEQARVREIIEVYRAIPQATFAVILFENILKRADEAAISGDLVAILRSYEEMKGCE